MFYKRILRLNFLKFQDFLLLMNWAANMQRAWLKNVPEVIVFLSVVNSSVLGIWSLGLGVG